MEAINIVAGFLLLTDAARVPLGVLFFAATVIVSVLAKADKCSKERLLSMCESAFQNSDLTLESLKDNASGFAKALLETQRNCKRGGRS